VVHEYKDSALERPPARIKRVTPRVPGNESDSFLGISGIIGSGSNIPAGRGSPSKFAAALFRGAELGEL
jgi:hypothetical protein